MLPVGGRPALEHIITYLRRHGFSDLVVAVSHLADQITSYFGNGAQYDVNITYSYSKEPSGTAGEVWKARESIDGTFICYYGDIITNLDLNRMVKLHREHGGIATIALIRGVPLEVGVVDLDGSSRITQFREKPLLTQPVNAAIYVLEQDILQYIERCDGKKVIDFGYDIFPQLLQDDRAIYGCVYENGNYWYDLGTIRRYQQINRFFSQRNARLNGFAQNANRG
jgi:mannose-1-phosphate guanylyltransferase/phosphomannomutase